MDIKGLIGPVRVQKVTRMAGKDGKPGYGKVSLVWMGGVHSPFVELDNLDNFEKVQGRDVMLSGRLEPKAYDLKLSDLKVAEIYDPAKHGNAKQAA